MELVIDVPAVGQNAIADNTRVGDERFDVEGGETGDGVTIGDGVGVLFVAATARSKYEQSNRQQGDCFTRMS